MSNAIALPLLIPSLFAASNAVVVEGSLAVTSGANAGVAVGIGYCNFSKHVKVPAYGGVPTTVHVNTVPPAQVVEVGLTRIHTVKSGESLSLIAMKYYGNPNFWPLVYDANEQKIGPNYNHIEVDWQLKIPPASLAK